MSIQPHQPARVLQSKTPEKVDLSAIVIETPRLILKPVSLDYAEVVFKSFTPAVARYTFPRSPEKIEETIGFITGSIESSQIGVGVDLLILNRKTGEFCGLCGLSGQNDTRNPEFGVWLAESAHGNGFGKEAIVYLRLWAIANLDVDGFLYPVDRNNIASRRIPESLNGVVIDEQIKPTMSGGTLDCLIYRISN